MTLQQQVTDAFQARYGAAPAAVVQVPGRINLIGGHTDYNGGYVLPINIDRYTLIALRARDDDRVNLHHTTHNADEQYDLTGYNSKVGHWLNPILAMTDVLQRNGYDLHGWDGVIASELPDGIEMGAEAALMIGAASAFAVTSAFDFDREAIARLAQTARREWLGMPLGVGDLLSIAIGQAGQALLVDELNGDYERVDFPETARAIVLDTGERVDAAALRNLIETRIAETEVAVKSYRVNHLRDLSMSRFEKDAEELDDLVSNRAKHILTENGRAILASEMLRSSAIATVGRLMNDSHESLKDLYDVTSTTADQVVGSVLGLPNVLGARSTDYGMGGVNVALVSDLSADTVSKLVISDYKRASNGGEVSAFVTRVVHGVKLL
ncbi:MAG: galactokinase family protein [Chloroflexota bacterium]